jgi:gamma-glutamyl-gamma-aminobutyraldehyde dehydrogenase
VNWRWMLGRLNVITGMGSDDGEPLGRHMDVDALTLTVSTETGRRHLEHIVQANLKEVRLEMGRTRGHRNDQ